MATRIDYQLVDIALVVIANLVNLLMVGIFLSRPKGWDRVEHVLGLILLTLAVPTAVIVVLNIGGKREWWTWIKGLILFGSR